MMGVLNCVMRMAKWWQEDPRRDRVAFKGIFVLAVFSMVVFTIFRYPLPIIIVAILCIFFSLLNTLNWKNFLDGGTEK